MNLNRPSFLSCVALLMTSLTVLAQSYDITQGSIRFYMLQNDNTLYVSQNGEDNPYTFINNTFPNITIYGNGTATQNNIEIDVGWGSYGYDPIITLSNVVIHCDTSIPLNFTSQSDVKLFLAPGSSNELITTADDCPGIMVFYVSSVITFKGSGTLVAVGGNAAAGIGGNYEDQGGTINIEDSVHIIAYGGVGGAGIGGGEANDGKWINISSNATVFAQGGHGGWNSWNEKIGGGAGIGGGGMNVSQAKPGGAGGTITISGNACVTAQGGESASGIGGGEEGAGGTISVGISNKVVAVSDGTRPAIDDDGGALDGDGYVMQLDYYNPKTAGTTNTVLLSGKAVTNVVAAVAYQSLALSLAEAHTYRVRCNDIPQESQGDTKFPVLATGLAVFTAVADTNSLPFTTTTPVEVPHEWLAEYYPSEPESNYEDLANSVGANGFYVWESYVAWLIPTNATSTFSASITLTNGTPYITWTPNNTNRVYTVQGKELVSDAGWGPTNGASRFFNVKVELEE